MLKDLLKKNRSYRGYNEERQVTEEELTDLVDCARLCPSSINGQPFRYYLAWKKEEVDRIQAQTKWARALKDLTLPHPGMCPTAFIVICQDTRLGANLNTYQKDVGIVAQTMLLSATEKGLGGCMIGSFNADGIRKELKLPDYLVPMLVVAIGEPKERIVLKEIDEGESIAYYRDENDVHYVPKRKLKDIILKAGE